MWRKLLRSRRFLDPPLLAGQGGCGGWACLRLGGGGLALVNASVIVASVGAESFAHAGKVSSSVASAACEGGDGVDESSRARVVRVRFLPFECGGEEVAKRTGKRATESHFTELRRARTCFSESSTVSVVGADCACVIVRDARAPLRGTNRTSSDSW